MGDATGLLPEEQTTRKSEPEQDTDSQVGVAEPRTGAKAAAE